MTSLFTWGVLPACRSRWNPETYRRSGSANRWNAVLSKGKAPSPRLVWNGVFRFSASLNGIAGYQGPAKNRAAPPAHSIGTRNKGCLSIPLCLCGLSIPHPKTTPPEAGDW